jgi:hypothetical protein
MIPNILVQMLTGRITISNITMTREIIQTIESRKSQTSDKSDMNPSQVQNNPAHLVQGTKEDMPYIPIYI